MPGIKILIKRTAIKEQDLLIPDNVRKPPSTGTVLEIGPKVTFVKPGDLVVFSRYAGMSLENEESLQESDYIVLDEDEILTKIIEEE